MKFGLSLPNQGQYQHELISNSHLTILADQARLYLLSNWGELLAVLIGSWMIILRCSNSQPP